MIVGLGTNAVCFAMTFYMEFQTSAVIWMRSLAVLEFLYLANQANNYHNDIFPGSEYLFHKSCSARMLNQNIGNSANRNTTQNKLSLLYFNFNLFAPISHKKFILIIDSLQKYLKYIVTTFEPDPISR